MRIQLAVAALVNSVFIRPFPNNKILDWSKLKEFADVNFKFDENGGKFPKWEENNVGKGDWLVILGFNATLTAKVISWRSESHMCFLAFSHQYLHNFSYQSHRLLFSQALAEVRG